jgi:hypothetical protein
MLIGTAAFAVEEYGYYRDEFPDYIYNGSSGNLDWSNSPWKEYNDDGNVKTGAVHVDYTPEFCADEYKCLHLYTDGPLEEPVGAQRYADTSMMEGAELCFEMTSQGDVSGALVRVLVTRGDGWVPVKSFEAPTEYLHPIIDVSDFLSPEFGIRFELSGEIYGGEVFIDSVEVKGPFEGNSTTTSSTTTTTKPTTTTQPKQTTTSKPRPTTSTSEATTTTTERATTNTQPTTTTSIPETTTTTKSAVVVGPVEPPDGSGLRQTAAGLQFDHGSGMNGDMSMDKPEVLGVSLTVDYKMAVEFIEQSWMWMVGLLLIIATAIVTGLDRRRARSFPESV